jgi:hypothetical protein
MLIGPVAAIQRLNPDAETAALLNRELAWLDLNGRVLDPLSLRLLDQPLNACNEFGL